MKIEGDVVIKYLVDREGEVEFTIGGRDGFVMHTTVEGLDALFLQVGAAREASRIALSSER
ncbi:MAG: hypothetical protein ACT4NY_17535 [Pseudonocardiales bacterium]